MANKTTTREMAASLLDATHATGESGPRTFRARKELAEWLDTGRGTGIAGHIRFLASKVAAEAK